MKYSGRQSEAETQGIITAEESDLLFDWIRTALIDDVPPKDLQPIIDRVELFYFDGTKQ